MIVDPERAAIALMVTILGMAIVAILCAVAFLLSVLASFIGIGSTVTLCLAFAIAWVCVYWELREGDGRERE